VVGFLHIVAQVQRHDVITVGGHDSKQCRSIKSSTSE
jgi:hypothetical protein